jgi:hypothetical protein
MAKSRRGGASVPMVSVKSLPMTMMRGLSMTRMEDMKVAD